MFEKKKKFFVDNRSIESTLEVNNLYFLCYQTILMIKNSFRKHFNIKIVFNLMKNLFSFYRNRKNNSHKTYQPTTLLLCDKLDT